MKTTFTENEVLIIGFMLGKTLGIAEFQEADLTDAGAITAAGIVNSIMGTDYVLLNSETEEPIL